MWHIFIFFSFWPWTLIKKEVSFGFTQFNSCTKTKTHVSISTSALSRNTFLISHYPTWQHMTPSFLHVFRYYPSDDWGKKETNIETWHSHVESSHLRHCRWERHKKKGNSCRSHFVCVHFNALQIIKEKLCYEGYK